MFPIHSLILMLKAKASSHRKEASDLQKTNPLAVWGPQNEQAEVSSLWTTWPSAQNFEHELGSFAERAMQTTGTHHL